MKKMGVLSIIIILISLLMISGCTDTISTKTDQPEEPNNNANVEDQKDSDETQVEKEWYYVNHYSGGSDRETSSFKVEGSQIKIVWDVKGDIGSDFSNFHGAFCGRKGSCLKTWHSSFVPNHGVTYIEQVQPDYYYVDIECDNVASWSIEIYEWK